MKKFCKTYWRRHINSGKIEELAFDASHALEARQKFQGTALMTPEGLTLLTALQLVNNWNMRSDMFKYHIN